MENNRVLSYSINHSVTKLLFDAPGTEACASELRHCVSFKVSVIYWSDRCDEGYATLWTLRTTGVNFWGGANGPIIVYLGMSPTLGLVTFFVEIRGRQFKTCVCPLLTTFLRCCRPPIFHQVYTHAVDPRNSIIRTIKHQVQTICLRLLCLALKYTVTDTAGHSIAKTETCPVMRISVTITLNYESL